MDTPGTLRGAVVLTTHERSGYFTSVLGDDIDLRFNPRQSASLYNTLHNILVAGGRLVIIDEAFFIDVDELAAGLEQFIVRERDARRLKIIIVCAQRQKGDLFLAFLVMYCGIYNIIYDKSGVDVSIELSKLILQDNTRSDVIELAQELGWQCAKRYGRRMLAEAPSDFENEETVETVEIVDPVELDQVIELGDLWALNVHIELLAERSV